jgi:hypothetical protein
MLRPASIVAIRMARLPKKKKRKIPPFWGLGLRQRRLDYVSADIG